MLQFPAVDFPQPLVEAETLNMFLTVEPSGGQGGNQIQLVAEGVSLEHPPLNKYPPQN